ncbi:hypothetical protein MFIFM68171_05616 [Madurella fahalii]|uniref:Uncharacterized protein n=1 Tax=Madurella fahalii TaxID=1157608 RepID=A0ABQ0GCB6_9PEZI
MRNELDGRPDAIRIMIHGPFHTPTERDLLADHGIESVTDREAIMAIDRRSAIVDVMSTVPIMDVIADFPEKPAIILTNRFAVSHVSRGLASSRAWAFMQSYKMNPLCTNLKFGTDIPIFDIYFRKDPRNRFSLAFLDSVMSYDTAVLLEEEELERSVED